MLQTQDHDRRGLQARVEQRISIEESLVERDARLTECDAILPEYPQAHQRNVKDLKQQLQVLLKQYRKLEDILMERERTSAELAARVGLRQELLGKHSDQKLQQQASLERCSGFEALLQERERWRQEREAAQAEGWQQQLRNQEEQRQQLQAILDQSKVLEASQSDYNAKLCDLEAQHMAIRKSKTWQLSEPRRRLGRMLE